MPFAPVSMIHRIVIDAEQDGDAPEDGADFHRGTLGDNITMNDISGRLMGRSWSSRPRRAITRSPPSGNNTATGDVRDVYTETVATHFESITGWQVL
jgi:hypothetical protein